MPFFVLAGMILLTLPVSVCILPPVRQGLCVVAFVIFKPHRFILIVQPHSADMLPKDCASCN